jgi:hypothetical protein
MENSEIFDKLLTLFAVVSHEARQTLAAAGPLVASRSILTKAQAAAVLAIAVVRATLAARGAHITCKQHNTHTLQSQSLHVNFFK